MKTLKLFAVICLPLALSMTACGNCGSCCGDNSACCKKECKAESDCATCASGKDCAKCDAKKK